MDDGNEEDGDVEEGFASDVDWLENENDPNDAPVQDLFNPGIVKFSEFLEACDSIEVLFAGTMRPLIEVFALITQDDYEVIKLVNYSRQYFNVASEADGESEDMLFKKYVDQLETKAFLDEKYLKPVVDGDMLLVLLPEYLHPSEESDDDPASKEWVNPEEVEITELKKYFADEFEVEADANKNISSFKEKLLEREIEGSNKVDEEYFESYDFMDIHREMLSDIARNEAYRAGLKRIDCKKKVVLDIGCGTSILTLFALESGAELVIAIDNSNIAFTAMEILRSNDAIHPEKRILQRVILLKGRAEDLISKPMEIKILNWPSEMMDIPGLAISSFDKIGTLNRFLVEHGVDVIVSEWMGYGLLFESMLDSVLTVRSSVLKSDGTMCPSDASIYVEAVCSQKFAKFKSFYGFDFSSVSYSDARVAQVENVSPNEIISNRVKVIGWNLKICQPRDLDFVANDLQVKINKDTFLTGLVLTFDCNMTNLNDNLEPPIVLSTACNAVQTHWHQVVLHFNDLIKNPEQQTVLKQDDILHVSIGYKKSKENSRSLRIYIEVIFPNNYKYANVFKLS